MFALHNLGWNDFQQLCLTITREILGQTVESFLDSGDGGRDGAFTGTWNATGEDSLSGRFVIQCKFTSRINYVLRTSDLSDEGEKARKLVGKGLCDSYLLMTNAGLSGTGAGEIKTLFEGAGVKQVATFGSTWIGQQIRENKRLRMLVPRVYGLGVHECSSVKHDLRKRQEMLVVSNDLTSISHLVAPLAHFYDP
jgi:hypothetical protein